MTYYEKGEHFLKETHTKHGYSRETLDEKRWQKEQKDYNYRPLSEQKFDRIVDDYRRTDYGPDDGFV